MTKKIIGAIALEIILFCGFLGVKCFQEYPDSSVNQALMLDDENTIIGMAQGKNDQYLFEQDEDDKTITFILGNIDALDDYDGQLIDYNGDYVYVFLKKESSSTSYAIVNFDMDLNEQNILQIKNFPTENITGFTVEDGVVYITSITDSGNLAKTYSIDTNALLEGGEVTYEVYDQKTADEGNKIISADYMEGEILVQYDCGTLADEAYIHDYDEDVYVNALNLRFALIKEYIVAEFFYSIFAWIFICLFAFFAFNRRSYGFQKFVIFEVVMIFICFTGIILGQNYINEQTRNSRETTANTMLSSLEDKLGMYTISDKIESTEEYETLFDTIYAFWIDEGKADFFSEISLVTYNEGNWTIDVSTGKPKDLSIEDVYGTTLVKQFTLARENMEATCSEIKIKGSEYGVVVRPWSNEAIAEHFIFALVPMEGALREDSTVANKFNVTFILLLSVGTLLIAIVTILEARDINHLSRTMERVALGANPDEEKPKNKDWDLESAWNSLSEIYKDKEKLIYARQKAYQAYYRFIPRNLEKIFGAKDLNEVKVGDLAKLNITAALISLEGMDDDVDEKDYIEKLNNKLEIICRHQNKNDGVMIANESNICEMDSLFISDDGSKKAVNFAIDTMHELDEKQINEEKNIGILIHKLDITYGIAGSDERAFPFIISNRLNTMKEIEEKFREKNARLVVTKEVEETLPKSVERKYIGYYYLQKEDKKIEFYEILDAYGVQEKEARKRALGSFMKGLELFYKNDFYFARNAFAESFKVCPNDHITLWYLFQSEKLLNSGELGDRIHGLFEEVSL